MLFVKFIFKGSVLLFNVLEVWRVKFMWILRHYHIFFHFLANFLNPTPSKCCSEFYLLLLSNGKPFKNKLKLRHFQISLLFITFQKIYIFSRFASYFVPVKSESKLIVFLAMVYRLTFSLFAIWMADIVWKMRKECHYELVKQK